MTLIAATTNAYARTAKTLQFDTLDAIAYRFFGSESNRYLPKLIELNAQYNPHAILPMRCPVILPDTLPVGSYGSLDTLKLWD